MLGLLKYANGILLRTNTNKHTHTFSSIISRKVKFSMLNVVLMLQPNISPKASESSALLVTNYTIQN
jgi:aspartate/glutamate racemase